MPSRPTLYTIGHSNHSLEAFLALLAQRRVSHVCDVRSMPYSRRCPQFNRETLTRDLAAADVEYVYLGEDLGARREESECYVDNVATYERIARLPRFLAGLARVRELAAGQTPCLMCAEKEPLHCHRSVLICRHLRDDLAILHIGADGGLEPHAHVEQRLMKEMKIERTLFEPDASAADLVEQAYEKRAAQIAYRRA